MYRVSRSKDLHLCYMALLHFFSKNAPYVCLTSLALITRDALSDVNSIIPSKMDMLMVSLIWKMIKERITSEELGNPLAASKDERFLFLESLYSCLFMIVKRCKSLLNQLIIDLYMQIPVTKDVIAVLLRPIDLYSGTVGNSNRMSILRSSMSASKIPSVLGEMVSICVQALEVYCNAGKWKNHFII